MIASFDSGLLDSEFYANTDTKLFKSDEAVFQRQCLAKNCSDKGDCSGLFKYYT